MIALVIFIACLGLIITALAYDYLRGRLKSKQVNIQLITSEDELHQLRTSERHLREEVGELQKKLRHTFEDPITHLLGWRLFEDRVKLNIKECERYHFTMGIVFVDVDGFKTINDAMGYEVADALLVEISKRLQTCIRQVDSLSRFSKDTFVMMLAQLSKPETAAIVGQRVLQVLNEPFQIMDQVLNVTACVGIALYPNDGETAEALFRNADHALHLAKEKGKHICQFYEERLHIQSRRELALYMSLSQESTYKEFNIYYQPVYNIRNKQIMCMDGLLYWNHAELGLVHPQEIMEYAEKQRKSNQVSSWLFKHACQHFLEWRKSSMQVGMLCLPLSIKQLENTHFVYHLSQLLQELSFPSECLLISLQGNFTQASFDIIEKAFNMLEYLGVKLAVDDFGAQSLAMRYLKSIHVDYIRMDSSFALDVKENEKTRALVRSLIYLAANLGMQLIVQGVENQDQFETLKELGCTLLQGPFLSAPMQATEVSKKLTELISS